MYIPFLRKYYFKYKKNIYSFQYGENSLAKNIEKIIFEYKMEKDWSKILFQNITTEKIWIFH